MNGFVGGPGEFDGQPSGYTVTEQEITGNLFGTTPGGTRTEHRNRTGPDVTTLGYVEQNRFVGGRPDPSILTVRYTGMTDARFSLAEGQARTNAFVETRAFEPATAGAATTVRETRTIRYDGPEPVTFANGVSLPACKFTVTIGQVVRTEWVLRDLGLLAKVDDGTTVMRLGTATITPASGVATTLNFAR